MTSEPHPKAHTLFWLLSSIFWDFTGLFGITDLTEIQPQTLPNYFFFQKGLFPVFTSIAVKSLSPIQTKALNASQISPLGSDNVKVRPQAYLNCLI